ncbi:Rho termination factor N-terminal domain-containing protein [Microbacterium resistens]
MSITLTHPVKGRQVTVPDDVADSYISQGWVVPGSPALAEQETADISKLKVDELRAYAEEHGIDLGDAKKKADIVSVIEAAASAEEDGDADADDAEAGSVPADADGGADDQG